MSGQKKDRPFSPWIRAGDFVFVSGQTGFDQESKTIADSIEEQTKQTLKNIESILRDAGTRMDQVVKTTVFLSDIKLFQQMSQVYVSFFPGKRPARTTVEARNDNDPKMLIEIDAIAYCGK